MSTPNFVKFAEGLIIDPANIARIVINPNNDSHKYRIKIHYVEAIGGGCYNIDQGLLAEKMVVKFNDPAVWKALGLKFVDFAKIPSNYKPKEETPTRSIEL